MHSLKVGSRALSLGLAVTLAGFSGPMPPVAAAPPTTAVTINGLLAFDAGASGEHDIYVSTPQPGAEPLPLTDTPGNDTMPSWSADGSRIVFVSVRSGGYDIWVMGADGSGQTRLTQDPGLELNPAFSPDGTRIAFTRYEDGIPEVWVMDDDGANQARLTGWPAPPGDPDPNRSFNYAPAWSPDGHTLAVTSERRGLADIFGIDVSGEPQTELTAASTGGSFADWSPSGDRLVLQSDWNGGPLVTVAADGGDMQSVAGTASGATEPAWSADGLAIAYQARTPDHWQVHVLGLDGVESAVVSMPGMDVEHPDWQPLAAPVVRRPDLWVRRSDRTTWLGDDVYAPSPQKVRVTVRRGKSVRLWVAAENDGTDADVLVLRGTGSGKGLSVAYRRGSTGVTRAVVAGTCRLPSLAPGAEPRTLRVDVTVSRKLARGTTRTLTVRATSAGSPATDLVTVKVRVS